MFLVTLVFECDCGVQFGVAPNPKTGVVGPGVGVRACAEHAPSQIDLNPKPWDPTGLVVKDFRIEQQQPEAKAKSAIVRPDVARVVEDFEQKLKT